jgi:hypothetical protein
MSRFGVGLWKSVPFVFLALYVVACSDTTPSPTSPSETSVGAAAAAAKVLPARHGGGGASGSGSGGSGSGSGGGSGSGSGTGSGSGSGGSGSDHGGCNSNCGGQQLGPRVDFEGAVQTTGSSCPTLQLTVAGQRVVTAASTEFRHLLCTEVIRGLTIRVRGHLQTGGVVLASRIVNRDRDNDDDDDDEEENDDEVEAGENKVEGPIEAIIDACPTPTLMIGDVTVTTSSLTKFDDIACSDLAAGLDVEVEGVTQSPGILLATKIELRSNR